MWRQPDPRRRSGTLEGDMAVLPLVFDAPTRALPPRHLADLDPAERRAAVVAAGLPAFRADQLSRHYFDRLESEPAAMTDLPSTARSRLGDALLPALLTEVRRRETDGGSTRKTLWRLHDGTPVETVLMRYPARRDQAERTTVCVSSQAGCGMGCPFCATGQGGLTRNLSSAEIVEQVRSAARTMARGELPGGPGRVSNVVFMGMGEPLANYPRVVAALHRLVDFTAGRIRALATLDHRLDSRIGARDRSLGGRGARCDAGGLAARARRRTPRHPGAGEHPMADRRGAARGRRVRRRGPGDGTRSSTR